MINSLLTSFILPPFSTIRPEHIVPAINTILKSSKRTVERLLKQSEFDWDNFCQPLEEIDDGIRRIWSSVEHLNAVKNNPELREAYEKSLPMLTEYDTWFWHHKDLYHAYCHLRHSDYYSRLNEAQRKTVDNILRDFELSGITLSKIKKKRYGQILTRLSQLSSTYNNNLLDSTMGWSKLITNVQELSGLPNIALSSARAQAESHQKEGWLLTLDLPLYLAVLTYCDNVSLREELYRAYHTRASDQGPNAGKWDNGPIMTEIVTLRHELAQLLNFKNYADKSIVTKMARNSQQVLDFLTNLVTHVRWKGKQELKQLYIFSKEYYGKDSLNLWDIAYYSEKQKQSLFSISDEQLRPYFPEHRVVSGLFEVVNRIYGFSAKERYDVDTWSPEVRFFELFDSFGELRGSFYMDLYTRDNKREGAWMQDCIGMMRKSDGTLQKPVAYLTCNFNPPIHGKPALFTHNDVITLFHEAGHGLHHILTCIETPGVSGISGIPWDAIELPSQLMENFCWQPEALEFISGHYKTGEPLPPEVLSQLINMKNYQIALFLLRQLELSLFDFRLHYEYDINKGAQIMEMLVDVKKKIAVLPTEAWDRYSHSFSHIFSGSYAAGYYSYLWANVLSADAWSRFEEEGIFNRKTGQSFLDEIISRGGSEDPMVLFTRFRGRDPNINAMLRHYDLIREITDEKS